MVQDGYDFDKRWRTLAVLCLSLVIVVVGNTVLNVALPTLVRELGATSSQLQWIVDSYALVFAALLLPAGALGDRFGRKRALLLGLAVFAVGSLVGGLATASTQVIVGRVITGVGAAFVMPATLSLLTTIFPPEERRKAIATWAGFAGAGGALGPIVSGALLEGFWWGSAMLANVPIVAAVLVAVWVFSPTSRDPDATPLDPPGAVLSLLGLGGLIFAIIEGPDRGWTSPVIVGAFVLFVVMLAGFLVWERRTEHPMLPLDLFLDRRLSVGAGVVTIAFLVMFGLFFLFTMYLQFVRGYSPLRAGLSTLPLAVTLVMVAPRSATLAERFGTGPVVTAGFSLVGAGFAVLALIGPTTPYLVLAVALVLLGAGMSLTAAPATGSIMSSVPHAKAGVGSAVNDTTREVGGALGVAVLGSVMSSVYTSNMPGQVPDAARNSIGAAMAIAGQVGEVPGRALALAASNAFVDGIGVALLIGAAVAGVGSLVAWLALPARSHDFVGDEPEDADEVAIEPALT